MAAREHQPQPLIGDRAQWLALLVGLRAANRGEALDVNRPLAATGVGAQAVDRSVPRADADPRGRIGGDAGDRPALECDQERVLDGLLGPVEVAQRPSEQGDRLPRLTPEQAIDDDGGSAQPCALSDCTWASSRPIAS
jgi:hypothetical protein